MYINTGITWQRLENFGGRYLCTRTFEKPPHLLFSTSSNRNMVPIDKHLCIRILKLEGIHKHLYDKNQTKGCMGVLG